MEVCYMYQRNIKHLYNLGIHISHALPDAMVIATPNKNKSAQNQAAIEKFVREHNISTLGFIPRNCKINVAMRKTLPYRIILHHTLVSGSWPSKFPHPNSC